MRPRSSARLRPVRRALGERLRRGRNRRDRRPQLVRDVADERPPHRFGLLEPRHVAQHPHRRRPVAVRKGHDGDLPDAVVGQPHDPVGRFAGPCGRLEAIVEGLLAQELVDAAAGRRRHSGHGGEAFVGLQDPELRVHDHESIGQGLEDHGGQPPLALRALEGHVERILHPLNGPGQELDLLAAGARQVASEVAGRDRRGALRELGDRLGEPAGSGRADQEQSQARRGDRQTHGPEVAELDLAQAGLGDRQPQHAAVREPSRDVEHGPLLGRRNAPRASGAGRDRLAHFLAPGVVLHRRHVGGQQVRVVEDPPVRRDVRHATLELLRGRAEEVVAPGVRHVPAREIFRQVLELAPEPLGHPLGHRAADDGVGDEHEHGDRRRRQDREERGESGAKLHRAASPTG